jgi:hypothetical protein
MMKTVVYRLPGSGSGDASGDGEQERYVGAVVRVVQQQHGGGGGAAPRHIDVVIDRRKDLPWHMIA